MALSASFDCPFCNLKRAQGVCSNFFLRSTAAVNIPKSVELLAALQCSHCNSIALGGFVKRAGLLTAAQTVNSANSASGSIENFQPSGTRIFLTDVFPEPTGPIIPEHLPDNVRRSFLDAENSLIAGLYTPAGMSYGKAVDRAITPLINSDGKKLTLGQKLRKLRDLGTMPPPILDLIDAVLDDRNFAAHDDEQDFESADDVAEMRDLADILLTYLFTLPEKIRVAKAAAAERKAKGVAGA